MKISFDWLKNYVDLKISPDKLATLLNMAGLGVDKEYSVDGDSIFEVEVTPNRPDCLSYLGIAREVAAVLKKPLKIPKVKEFKPTKQKTQISIDDKNGCSRYIGAVVQNISIANSPSWLQKNLKSIGSRAINNIVDITNFCLMEQGQPLHAFDYDKLIGGKIIVRRARAGETIGTIDGLERKLDPSILVIADEKRPVAIAGIMGSKETEVTVETKNILLESAYFDPILIRQASRKLGLSSDSSYRFERRVNFDKVKSGADRALALIQETTGGQILSLSDVIAAKPAVSKKPIVLTLDHIEKSLGTQISLTETKSILNRLNFSVSAQKNSLKVFPLSSRADIKIEADLVEEIARVIGYDKLPATLPQVRATEIPLSQTRQFRNQIRSTLRSLGLDEIVTYSLTNQKNLEKTNLPNQHIVKIQNPLSLDQEILRPHLLPSFLPVVASNLNRGQKDLKFFEALKVYSSSGEKEALGILLTGFRSTDWRNFKKEEVDVFDLKGIVERLFEKAPIEKFEFSSEPFPYFDEAQSVGIKIEGKPAGVMGKISSEVLSQWDIRAKNLFFAQIDLEILRKYRRDSVKRFEPVPEFPPIIRDISLAIKNEITFDQVKSIARKEGVPFLSSIRLLEEYSGEKIQSGSRGIIFSLLYQSPSRTLREDEVSQTHDRITQALVERLGAVRR